MHMRKNVCMCLDAWMHACTHRMFNIFGFIAMTLVNLGLTTHGKLTAKEKAKKQRNRELRQMSSDPEYREARQAFDKIDVDESGMLDRLHSRRPETGSRPNALC